MAYNEGAIVQGTVVEMQPPVARVLSMEVERVEPLLGDAYADDADIEPGDDALAHAAARPKRFGDSGEQRASIKELLMR